MMRGAAAAPSIADAPKELHNLMSNGGVTVHAKTARSYLFQAGCSSPESVWTPTGSSSALWALRRATCAPDQGMQILIAGDRYQGTR